MNVFSDAMIRSHPGSYPAANYQLYTDKDIGEFVKIFTNNFVALGDYRMKLMEEAYQTGIPITRSLMLEYPDDTTARKIDDQFMLGSDIMVAPILEDRQVRRNVYFPKGSVWKHMIVNNFTIDATE